MIRNGGVGGLFDGRSELQKRVITGAIGAIVLIALLVFGGRIGTSIFAGLMALAMMAEYTDLVLELPDRSEKRFTLLGIVWLTSFVHFWVPRVEYELLLISFLGLFAYFLWTAQRHGHQPAAFRAHFNELAFSIFGLLYLGFLPLYLPLLREGAAGLHWVMLFFLINWAGDVGAYFSGLRWGKRRLYPLISPKKSQEGALGGLLSSVAIALTYRLVFFQELTVASAVVIALAVGVTAQVGDLCESFVKRVSGKKDSGSLLPGHGGFLDRFDGVVFSLPVMYACVRIFG
jgi:phosphatidate cytidylyltransferase